MKVKWGPAGRRFAYRSVLPTLILLGVVTPFVFIRIAFFALDAGASFCPSIGCLGRRIGPLFFRGGDSSLELVKELRKTYEAERGEPLDSKLVEDAPNSWNDLMAEITSYTYQELDLRAFLLKTRAMLMKMDNKVQSARMQASLYRHLASIGVPKNMHCLALRLAEEYLVNANARSSLPPPEYAYRLTNSSYIHFALLTDNILGASVVVFSTLKSSANPERLIFHVITDKKTYTAMHAWFALNSVSPAILEVKGLHQFDWPLKVNEMILETVQVVRECLSAYHTHRRSWHDYERYEAPSSSSFSLLNYLKIHLPELFPKLERVIFLDDDLVVQQDLSPLWDTDLKGKVIGAVGIQNETGARCTEKRQGDHLNFSNPLFSSLPFALEPKHCAWFLGMNLFNLEAWRMTNITRTYQSLIKLASFYPLAYLPKKYALIVFNDHKLPLEHSWHLPGLGQRIPQPKHIEAAAVLHFSGPFKPWLDVGFSELRGLWRSHLNHSSELLKRCRVVE
ncbi:putative galacturonosyltransferase 15 [Apostasia shenzhenica]|uniref:Hexosyltransferase n=1 Tax=Apostasia shenzhenica TaxID=1088818 RepID=A0A2I0AGA8_9ASPA|nr:putative galacturonosyltransferase 15 [Apostasia shenzhenica]